MSNYPDDVTQASFDRYWNDKLGPDPEDEQEDSESLDERNERLAEARYVDADLDGCSLEDWQAYQNDHRYKAELPFADWIQQFEEKK